MCCSSHPVRRRKDTLPPVGSSPVPGGGTVGGYFWAECPERPSSHGSTRVPNDALSSRSSARTRRNPSSVSGGREGLVSHPLSVATAMGVPCLTSSAEICRKDRPSLATRRSRTSANALGLFAGFAPVEFDSTIHISVQI